MPFYPGDYVNDERVMHLSPTGRATYIELLCHSWMLGGSLPYSPAHLWKYTLLESPEAWKVVADEVLSMFKIVDGRLVNPRLAVEYEESQRLADARIRGGKKTAAKRWKETGNSSPDSSATSSANSSGVGRREENRRKEKKKASEPPSADSVSVSFSETVTGSKTEPQNQPGSGSNPQPVPPTEAGVRVAQKLLQTLGRKLKPATLTAWCYQADALLKTHSEETLNAVMQWALVESTDGFWRARVVAMKVFVKCFKTMLSQYQTRGLKPGAAAGANPLAARAASLGEEYDFSAQAKGDF
jgi:uncharacterized protein YdaU (DUF1376 family)